MAFNGSIHTGEFWANPGASLPAHVGAQFATGFACDRVHPVRAHRRGFADREGLDVRGLERRVVVDDARHADGPDVPERHQLHVLQRAISYTLLPAQRERGPVGGNLVAVSNLDIDGAPHRTNHGGSSGESWIVRKGPSSERGRPEPDRYHVGVLRSSERRQGLLNSGLDPAPKSSRRLCGDVGRVAHPSHGQAFDRRHGTVDRRDPPAHVEHGCRVVGVDHVPWCVVLRVRRRLSTRPSSSTSTPNSTRRTRARLRTTSPTPTSPRSVVESRGCRRWCLHVGRYGCRCERREGWHGSRRVHLGWCRCW